MVAAVSEIVKVRGYRLTVIGSPKINNINIIFKEYE